MSKKKSTAYFKIIDRYILNETIGPFLIGTGFFTFIFVIQKIRDLVKLSIEKAIPIYVTAQLFLYMLPFTAAITIPMGVLFGILLAFGRLSSHSEIIAMRANGISIYRTFLPAGLFGIIISAGLFIFINYVVPETNLRYRILYRSVMYSNPGIFLEDRVFTDLPNTQKKISSLSVSEDGNEMDSVFIYELENNKIKITYAKKGMWSNNNVNSPLISLHLKNGRSFEIGLNDFKEIQNLEFGEIEMNIINTIRSTDAEIVPGPRESSVWTIARQIKEKKDTHKYVSSKLYVELHKKITIPVACLAFVIIGMPLAVSFNRSGRGIGFVSAIIIIFVYYLFMVLGETLGNKDMISPHFSMWIPNFVLFVIGIFLFIQKTKE